MFLGLLPETSSRRVGLVAVYAMVALLLAVVALVDPVGSPLYPKCVFHAVTGLHCPGCGGLRAVHQALRGHLLTAIGLNPLILALVPMAAYGVISDAAFVASGRPLPWPRLRPWVVPWIVGAIAAFWILRNIPVYPLTLLAP